MTGEFTRMEKDWSGRAVQMAGRGQGQDARVAETSCAWGPVVHHDRIWVQPREWVVPGGRIKDHWKCRHWQIHRRAGTYCQDAIGAQY